MTLYFLNRFCAPCIIRHVLAAVQIAEAKRAIQFASDFSDFIEKKGEYASQAKAD